MFTKEATQVCDTLNLILFWKKTEPQGLIMQTKLKGDLSYLVF